MTAGLTTEITAANLKSGTGMLSHFLKPGRDPIEAEREPRFADLGYILALQGNI